MTIEDVKKIIDGDETRTLEMKKTTGELKDGMRSVCAFLNTTGFDMFLCKNQHKNLYILEHNSPYSYYGKFHNMNPNIPTGNL